MSERTPLPESAAAIPPSTEWPKQLRTFLRQQLEARFFAPFGTTPAGREEGWRLLLAQTFRGQRLGAEMVPWAASPETVYPIALRYLEEGRGLTSSAPGRREVAR